MPKLILSALMLLITQPLLFAQVSQQWVQRYTTFNNDIAACVKTDASGNLYVLGTTNAWTVNGNIALVKYNSSGTQVWATFYNSPSNNADMAHAMALDAAGNIYVTGESTVLFAGGSSSEIVTIKFNSSGCPAMGNKVLQE